MKALRGLVIGGRGSLAIGRVGFWIAFGLSVYFWLARPVEAYPPALENIIGFLLAYNCGGKAVGKLGERKALNARP